MKLIDAMRVAKAPAPERSAPFRVLLCCGFTPLHLETFLTAHLRERLSGRPVAIDTGPYGGCIGTIERAAVGGHDVVCVALEWPDLDPRLGYRQLGGWGSSVQADILRTSLQQLDRLEKAVALRAGGAPVVICQPTLPLPPVSHTVRAQASSFELQLRRGLLGSIGRLAEIHGVSVVAQEFIDARSPLTSRLDIKAELMAGFPYRVPHASVLASAVAILASPAVPKKGLITDLDDTFWYGLVGEVGAAGVSYDLDSGTQMHAVYQQFLSSLAEAGVLIGVASRNDADVVKEALSRPDLSIARERLFPVEVNWGDKSQSVGRILEAWNIAADAVVVVDDSARELAEIQAVFPEVDCRQFPSAGPPEKVLMLLEELRDVFGRPRLTPEDRIRAASVREPRVHQPSPSTGASEQILASAGAELDVDFDPFPGDGRALELVNKTNQFNLNGRRYAAAEWASLIGAESAFVMTVAYRDRFGPLGRIGVVAGRKRREGLTVSTWVLSCRAFARQIEHQCLAVLFEHYGVSAIDFEYAATSRNTPLSEFFAGILGRRPAGPFTVSRAQFESWCPTLHQSVHVRI